jgi:hypothetical protein
MPPSINRKLNLVIPVDDTTRGTVYVHSTPLSLEVFEKYFEVISRSQASLYRQGQAVLTGPRIAAMQLRRAADDLNMRQEVDGGLFPEIERLTNVVALEQGKGWTSAPYHEAKSWLDADDKSEVENAIAFFIINSAVMLRKMLPAILGLMESLWGAQTTSLNCTEYAASLATSTQPEPTKEAAS